MTYKNKRDIPKEFCIQKPVEISKAYFTPETPVDVKPKYSENLEKKVIFTAEKPSSTNFNQKSPLANAVAALILMDLLK